MKCASALATAPDSSRAFREALAKLEQDLAGGPADLAVAFVSPHHADRLNELASQLMQSGIARHVIGCGAESVVADGREIENEPAVALWAIRRPGLNVQPIRLEDPSSGLGELAAPPEVPQHGDGRVLVVLGDPFTFPTDDWLAAINSETPGLRLVGGMASAADRPGANRLVLDSATFDDGGVAVLIDGPIRVDTVVSQGCRPIGRAMLITKADNNLIRELGRRPAVEVFRELYESLPPDEKRLVQQGLHIGRVTNEYREKFGRGDFLVRNVLGVDDSGALFITDRVRVGQTVQFHVRDAASADEDLRELLRQPGPDAHAAGALLFTCNGRGTRLFPGPDHDAAMLRKRIGEIPTAGFFAMGELGPIGGQNFMHGYTASIALFREAEE